MAGTRYRRCNLDVSRESRPNVFYALLITSSHALCLSLYTCSTILYRQILSPLLSFNFSLQIYCTDKLLGLTNAVFIFAPYVSLFFPPLCITSFSITAAVRSIEALLSETKVKYKGCDLSYVSCTHSSLLIYLRVTRYPHHFLSVIHSMTIHEDSCNNSKAIGLSHYTANYALYRLMIFDM